LALELTAAEDCVALGIEGFFEVTCAGRPAHRVIAVAEIAGQAAEDEAAESRVIGRDLEAERRDRPAQHELDRFGDFDLQIGVALVEGGGCIVRSAGEQLGGFCARSTYCAVTLPARSQTKF
jgi:hypothetical protein